MYFRQFLVGMFTTSGVVGAWAYVATGSIWKAVAWGIIAAVLLQVGYFALVFRLVYGGETPSRSRRRLLRTPPNSRSFRDSHCTETVAKKGLT
jgi:hypothetical protein